MAIISPPLREIAIMINGPCEYSPGIIPGMNIWAVSGQIVFCGNQPGEVTLPISSGKRRLQRVSVGGIPTWLLVVLVIFPSLLLCQVSNSTCVRKVPSSSGGRSSDSRPARANSGESTWAKKTQSTSAEMKSREALAPYIIVGFWLLTHLHICDNPKLETCSKAKKKLMSRQLREGWRQKKYHTQKSLSKHQTYEPTMLSHLFTYLPVLPFILLLKQHNKFVA